MSHITICAKCNKEMYPVELGIVCQNSDHFCISGDLCRCG